MSRHECTGLWYLCSGLRGRAASALETQLPPHTAPVLECALGEAPGEIQKGRACHHGTASIWVQTRTVHGVHRSQQGHPL